MVKRIIHISHLTKRQLRMYMILSMLKHNSRQLL
nr:MAG TPA: hypothetical protein [Caudoviricetes sp.]